MTTNSLDPPRDNRALARPAKIAAAGLCFAGAVLLLVNAQTMTICEDESNGFFLSHKPLGEVIRLMAANSYEDPPLWDVLLHAWTPIAGYDLGLLRGLPILFWLLTAPGLFLVTRRLAGPRAAWCSLVVLMLMPYHWTIPAAFRWYSFFAFLAVWNFFFFLRLEECARTDDHTLTGRKTRFFRGVPYVLTGACLWYTNYSAPMFFFIHLVVAMVRARRRRQIATDLALCWLAVSLLYLPWIATFLRQLGRSTRSVSFSYTGLSLYVLAAGEFSTPFHYWISVPAIVAGILLAALVGVGFRRCWVPVAALAVVMTAMLATGVIGPKRLLLASPFVAMIAGIALADESSRRRWIAAARTGLLAMAVLVAGGSLVHMFRQTGWVAYRWLDPCRAVVRQIRSETPSALVVSNSNPIFFYLGDQYGKNFCYGYQRTDPSYRPKAIHFPLKANYPPVCRELLDRADRVAWVYHSAYDGPISKWHDEFVDEMGRLGFRVSKIETFLRASPAMLKYHPRFRDRSSNLLDEYRLVVVHFDKHPQRVALY